MKHFTVFLIVIALLPVTLYAFGWAKHTISNTFSGAEGIYAIDVDGDNDVDVIATAYMVNDLVWWENDESENFSKQTIGQPFANASCVYCTDVDGDTDMDVLGVAFQANEIAWWASLLIGIDEQDDKPVENYLYSTTIVNGPLQIPKDKKYKVFDITGRQVNENRLAQGVYFIEIEGKITTKVVKIK